ncbi:hypothetical protein, partial [Enterobacter mori]|uniref:hypothetical protein n=1 Tax=Enterobacter mori TaxID=539813 RepID=UPI0032AF537E
RKKKMSNLDHILAECQQETRADQRVIGFCIYVAVSAIAERGKKQNREARRIQFHFLFSTVLF